MPVSADHPSVWPAVPPRDDPGVAAPPPPPLCGLLKLQEAILRDAAADVARIELRMAREQNSAWLLEPGLAAVAVLDHTIRLLQGQRPAVLDQLADVLLSAHDLDVPPIGRSGVTPRGHRAAGAP